MNQPLPPRHHNPRFLARLANGKARVRLTFEGNEAALMEEAAGEHDVVKKIHQWIKEGVARELEEQRATRTPIAPPPEGA